MSSNANNEVQILRYATESSFDAYLWQTVERKATFINQFMNGSLDADEVDEVESAEMTNMAAIKAVTSGNPLLLEHAEIQADAATLRRLETAHGRDQSHRQHQVVAKTNLIDRYITEVIPRLEAAVAARTDTTGTAFVATIDGQAIPDRRDAAEQVRAALNHGVVGLNQCSRPLLQMRDVARVGGHVIDATGRAGRLGQEATVDLFLRDAPERATVITAATLREDGIGVMTRMENLVSGLDRSLAAAHDAVATAHSERDEARSHLGEPFPRAADLARGQQQLKSVQSRLEAQPPRTRQRRTRRTNATGPVTTTVGKPQSGDSTGNTPSVGVADPVQQALQSRVNTDGLRRVREALEQQRQSTETAAGRAMAIGATPLTGDPTTAAQRSTEPIRNSCRTNIRLM